MSIDDFFANIERSKVQSEINNEKQKSLKEDFLVFVSEVIDGLDEVVGNYTKSLNERQSKFKFDMQRNYISFEILNNGKLFSFILAIDDDSNLMEIIKFYPDEQGKVLTIKTGIKYGRHNWDNAIFESALQNCISAALKNN